MLSVQNSFYTSSALDGIYSSMADQVSNMPSNILLANPDKYTGTSITKDLLRISIAENNANAASVNEGSSILQSIQDVTGNIEEKVEQMEALAESAANDGLTTEEKT